MVAWWLEHPALCRPHLAHPRGRLPRISGTEYFHMSWKWKKGVMVRRWLYKKRIAEQALRDIKDDIYLVDSRNLTSEGYPISRPPNSFFTPAQRFFNFANSPRMRMNFENIFNIFKRWEDSFSAVSKPNLQLNFRSAAFFSRSESFAHVCTDLNLS